MKRRGGRSVVFGWRAGRCRVDVEARLVGSRRGADKAVSREGSCSYTSEAVVADGIVLKGWRDDIVAVVAGSRLPSARAEAGNEGAARGLGCRVEEGHRRVGREGCSAVAERAVVVVVAVGEFAAAQG